MTLRQSPPTDIAGYTLLQPVRSVGNAVVYRAIQQRLQRTVAIKRMDRSSTNSNAISATPPDDQLLREAATLGRLRHPGITRSYDAGETATCQYLVTEWAEGQMLDVWLETHDRLPTAAACELARQIAGVLHYAQQQGVTHGRLAPQSLLLTESGTIKILDWGTARSLDEATTQNAAAVSADIASLGRCLASWLDNAHPSPSTAAASADRTQDQQAYDVALQMTNAATPSGLNTWDDVIAALTPLAHHNEWLRSVSDQSQLSILPRSSTSPSRNKQSSKVIWLLPGFTCILIACCATYWKFVPQRPLPAEPTLGTHGPVQRVLPATAPVPEPEQKLEAFVRQRNGRIKFEMCSFETPLMDDQEVSLLISLARDCKHISWRKTYLHSESTLLTEQTFAELATLPTLKSIGVNGCSLTPACIEYLSGLEELVVLDVYTPEAAGGVAAIGESLPRLHSLLLNAPLTDPDLRSLASLHELRHLYLNGQFLPQKFANESLQGVLSLRLDNLTLLYLPLNETTFANIGQIETLQKLHISPCPKTIWPYLNELPRLRELNLEGPEISTAALQDFANRRPDVQVSRGPIEIIRPGTAP